MAASVALAVIASDKPFVVADEEARAMAKRAADLGVVLIETCKGPLIPPGMRHQHHHAPHDAPDLDDHDGGLPPLPRPHGAAAGVGGAPHMPPPPPHMHRHHVQHHHHHPDMRPAPAERAVALPLGPQRAMLGRHLPAPLPLMHVQGGAPHRHMPHHHHHHHHHGHHAHGRVQPPLAAAADMAHAHAAGLAAGPGPAVGPAAAAPAAAGLPPFLQQLQPLMAALGLPGPEEMLARLRGEFADAAAAAVTPIGGDREDGTRRKDPTRQHNLLYIHLSVLLHCVLFTTISLVHQRLPLRTQSAAAADAAPRDTLPLTRWSGAQPCH